MPWWRLLSRQISRNHCWLKTSGIFRPGKTADLRQHLKSRCSKMHILAGEVLQSLTSHVFKIQLAKALVWCHGWPSFDKEVGSWRPLEVSSSYSGCDHAHGLLQCCEGWNWSNFVPLQILTSLQILLISRVCFKHQLTFSSSVSCHFMSLLGK